MTFAEAKQFLYGLRYHGAKYGLERMEAFDEALGRPASHYPVIHVAGTNGKGSTVAMLEAVYRGAGYRTGMFTSPHLIHVGERVQVNRTPLTEDLLTGYVDELMAVGQRVSSGDMMKHPSFFEFMVGLALLHFARAEVQVAAVEVGLGGRLDATNVVDPAVSVITSIGLDHCDILGETFAKIAYEKAGIIKPGKPVAMGLVPPEAEEVIRAVASERHAPLFSVRERFGDDLSRYPETNLAGGYQRKNAACAVLALELARDRGLPVNAVQIKHGLQTVTWAARWERRQIDRRTVIFDASHNPDGAEILDEHLRDWVRETGEKPRVLFGSIAEARARALLAVIAPYAKEIVLLKAHQPKALETTHLRTLVPDDFPGEVREATLRELFPVPGVIRLGEAGETLVATGSIYLVGEIMEAIHSGIAEGSLLQDNP